MPVQDVLELSYGARRTTESLPYYLCLEVCVLWHVLLTLPSPSQTMLHEVAAYLVRPRNAPAVKAKAASSPTLVGTGSYDSHNARLRLEGCLNFVRRQMMTDPTPCLPPLTPSMPPSALPICARARSAIFWGRYPTIIDVFRSGCIDSTTEALESTCQRSLLRQSKVNHLSPNPGSRKAAATQGWVNVGQPTWRRERTSFLPAC